LAAAAVVAVTQQIQVLMVAVVVPVVIPQVLFLHLLEAH
jgi:hypothetical protein